MLSVSEQHALVRDYLPVVQRAATRIARRSRLHPDDVLSVGYEALVKAVRTFDPARGDLKKRVTFVTSHRMKAHAKGLRDVVEQAVLDAPLTTRNGEATNETLLDQLEADPARPDEKQEREQEWIEFRFEALRKLWNHPQASTSRFIAACEADPHFFFDLTATVRVDLVRCAWDGSAESVEADEVAGARNNTPIIPCPDDQERYRLTPAQHELLAVIRAAANLDDDPFIDRDLLHACVGGPESSFRRDLGVVLAALKPREPAKRGRPRKK